MSDNAELCLDHAVCSCTILVIGDQRYAAIDCADPLHVSQSTSLGVTLRLEYEIAHPMTLFSRMWLGGRLSSAFGEWTVLCGS
jgi:hypothetical protein